MPEGPEIYILSICLNLVGIRCSSYGKHLYINDFCEDWSFGLTGGVKLINGSLIKVKKGFVYGSINKISFNDFIFNNKLGIDWLHADKNDLDNVIFNVFAKSNKKIGTLLLDQTYICGLGVAWSSEILNYCGINPNSKGIECNLSKLSSAMIYYRIKIINKYMEYLMNTSKIAFINNWYKNLYHIREMNVYKKGSSIKINGRLFWI